MIIEKHVFGPIKPGFDNDYKGAQLEFYGVNHYRPSFVASVYFNDTKITPDQADMKRKSFAGDFAVFGHEFCWGDKGHCAEQKEVRRFDSRPSPPLKRAFQRVDVTGALQHALKENDELTVTVIVAADSDEKEKSYDKLLDFQGLQLVTFS